jgi:hypothetical protein
MSLKGKLANKAAGVGAHAAEAAAERAQQAAQSATTRYRGLRMLFKEEDGPVTIENLLAAMVAAVRSDEHDEDRSSRDVYKIARSRRRRLGLMSFGAGPLAGAATQAVDLYTEMATFCDVAALHGHNLSEHQVAAHMLAIWGIVPDLAEAHAIMRSEAPQSLGDMLKDRVRSSTDKYIPDSSDKKGAVLALFNARHILDDGKTAVGAGKAAMGGGSVKGVVFAGHRTKQVIKLSERQLSLSASPGDQGQPAGLTGLPSGTDR